VLCAACVDRLVPAGPVRAPPGVDACVALVDYVDAGRELVLALKYGGARALVTAIGVAVASEVRDALAPGGTVDVVTWAPTSAARRRDRGFDQAQLLARSVARQLRVPPRALLRRAPGPPQTGRSRDERLVGPAFVARRGAPARVLLVDDVVTSGATLSAAARALRGAGADHVVAAVVAHTPPPRSTRDLARTGEARDLER
jgi:predicted amidophosphoribosyltransferase